MAVERPTESITRISGADLSAKQFFFVKLDSSGHAVVAGDGEAAIGVLQDGLITSGVACNIMTLGITKVSAGGSITAGNNVASDAAGEAVAASGSDAILGVALESASDGDLFSMLLVTRSSSGSNSGMIISIPIKLSKLADGDIVTALVPGISGKITKVQFVVTDPVTTADKLATLNLEIGTTNVTGGVISLTSANCTPLGAVVAGTAVSANNTLAAASELSVEAASVTAFVEGEGVLIITVQ